MTVPSELIKSNLPLLVERMQRPAHISIPRKTIDLPFAVQLMRSSYNTADELDFVPMDEFQKTFFLFRQSEWEDYRKYHPTALQGDLRDAAYFDFISFCQYATIAGYMRSGQLQFIEKVELVAKPLYKGSFEALKSYKR